MRKRNFKFGLVLVIVSLLSFSTMVLAMDSVTVTVTIRIEPFQQLTLKSENSAVTVEGGNNEVTSKVQLDEVDGSEVTLEPAVSAGVKSNVDWRLLAHTEEAYVASNGDKNYSSGPGLELKIPDPPGSVSPAGSIGTSYVPIGENNEEIATGEPGFSESFEIYYKLGFQDFTTDKVDGAGVDIVYTMMEV